MYSSLKMHNDSIQHIHNKIRVAFTHAHEITQLTWGGCLVVFM